MTTQKIDLSVLELSDKEEAIINTLLVGELSANEIAQKALIKRSSIYLYLENLKKVGLILEVEKANKKYYQIVSSTELEKVIQKKIDKLRELKKVLPELVSNSKKSKDNSNGHISVYKGVTGMSKILQAISKSTQEAYFLASTKTFYEFVRTEDWKKEYNKKRREKDLPEDYLITDYSEPTVREYFQNSQLFTKRRFMPEDFQLNGGLVIFEDKVAIGVLSKEVEVIVIEDPSFARLFKTLYQYYWKDLEGKNIPSDPAESAK